MTCCHTPVFQSEITVIATKCERSEHSPLFLSKSTHRIDCPEPHYRRYNFVYGRYPTQQSVLVCCYSSFLSFHRIRETSRRLIDSYFPDVRAAETRVEFLPVEWRNSLQLDGDIVDSLTLGNLSRLRTFLNCTFMDIMYYTSPLYRYEINHSLLVELNRLYCIFCEHHPYFEGSGGKVSILAHSLGCVISYDLITGWIEPVPPHLATAPRRSPGELLCPSRSA